MKNKILTALLFIGFCYVLPLAWNISLLLSPQVLILAGMSVVLFLTQPALSIRDTRENQSSDRLSVLVILGMAGFCQLFSLLERAYWPGDEGLSYNVCFFVGLLLLIGGMAFRIWSIRSLGSFFTTTVKTQRHQTIVTSGVYRLLRHPSYLGAYLTIVGGAVLLEARWGIVISLLGMFGAYFYRIRVEEATLLRVFGREYVDYQQKSKRMFPFLW